MQIETFDLERGQSLWEHRVDINLSESGVHPLTLSELYRLGLDRQAVEQVPLEYVQTNGTPELRNAIAGQYQRATADHVEVTNGTSEANLLLLVALIEPGDEVVVQMPNYLQVVGLARALGARVYTFELDPERDWAPDLDRLEELVGERTRLVYLSHPNNPTGRSFTPPEMERLASITEQAGAWVVADEVYRGAEHSGDLSPSFWGLGERVLVSCGLSKAYGLPGLRIGWLVAPPELAARCWSVHDYTTIAPAALSDRIARFALEPEIQHQLQARARRFMRTNREAFRDWSEGFGRLLDYQEPRAGAYAFVRYRSELPSIELCERLRERQSVLLVPGSWMGMEHYLRFGLGAEPEAFREGLERVGCELEALAQSG